MSNALQVMAKNTGVSTEEITEVVRTMIVSSKNQHGSVATDAEITVVSGICAQYGLNPLAKEAHAFVSGGKLSVTIGIDGWIKIMNRQATFNGVEFEDHFDGGSLTAVTTKIHIKGRDFPTCVTEYMDECFQPNSAAWKKFKKRMLRNKSLGQCVRVAFGISEVIDTDEADRIKSSEPAAQQERDVTPADEKDLSHAEYDADMAECGDLDTLKQMCGEIRKSLEAMGKWNDRKAEIIALNTKHKARINSYSEVVEEAEFEEVLTTEEAPHIAAAMDAEPDVPFEDEDEEF